MIKKFVLPLLVMGLASAAQAGSISYTADLPAGVAPYSESVALRKFDTTLGTLTGVTIQLDITDKFSGVVFSTLPRPVRYSNVIFSLSATLYGPDESTAAVQFTSFPYTGIATTVPNLLAPRDFIDSAKSSVPSANWGSYSGVGVEFASFIVASGLPGVTGSFGVTTFFNVTHSIGGTVTVTYDFTPATVVPEPATVAAALMGAAAFAFARLRRKAA